MLTRLMILDGLPKSQFHLQDKLATQNTVCSSVVLGRSVLVNVRVHMCACGFLCVCATRERRKAAKMDSRIVW